MQRSHFNASSQSLSTNPPETMAAQLWLGKASALEDFDLRSLMVQPPPPEFMDVAEFSARSEDRSDSGVGDDDTPSLSPHGEESIITKRIEIPILQRQWEERLRNASESERRNLEEKRHLEEKRRRRLQSPWSQDGSPKFNFSEMSLESAAPTCERIGDVRWPSVTRNKVREMNRLWESQLLSPAENEPQLTRSASKSDLISEIREDKLREKNVANHRRVLLKHDTRRKTVDSFAFQDMHPPNLFRSSSVSELISPVDEVDSRQVDYSAHPDFHTNQPTAPAMSAMKKPADSRVNSGVHKINFYPKNAAAKNVQAGNTSDLRIPPPPAFSDEPDNRPENRLSSNSRIDTELREHQAREEELKKKHLKQGLIVKLTGETDDVRNEITSALRSPENYNEKKRKVSLHWDQVCQSSK